VNENANPQNYLADGDEGNKYKNDGDIEKKNLLMVTSETVKKIMEVVKK
jgi:hypothetical protein